MEAAVCFNTSLMFKSRIPPCFWTFYARFRKPRFLSFISGAESSYTHFVSDSLLGSTGSSMSTVNPSDCVSRVESQFNGAAHDINSVNRDGSLWE
jgi:hypothetical protein